MAPRYYIDDGSGNTNTTAVWAEVTGGATGFSIPTSADDVVFDGNSNGSNVVLDAAFASKTITSVAGFTQNLDLNGFDTDAANGAINFDHAGTYDQGGSAVSVTGNFHVGTGVSGATTDGTITFAANGNLDVDKSGTTFSSTIIADAGINIRWTGAFNTAFTGKYDFSAAGSTFQDDAQSWFHEGSTDDVFVVSSTFSWTGAGFYTFVATANCTWGADGNEVTGNNAGLRFGAKNGVTLTIGRDVETTGSGIIQFATNGGGAGTTGIIDCNEKTFGTATGQVSFYQNASKIDASNCTMVGNRVRVYQANEIDVTGADITGKIEVTFYSTPTLTGVSSSTFRGSGACAFTNNGNTLGIIDADTAATITFADLFNARLTGDGTFVFKNGVTNVGNAYTAGDVDGATILTDAAGSASTWNNIAGMNVSNCDFKDITASNEIIASVDNGNTDSTGNTNIDFDPIAADGAVGRAGNNLSLGLKIAI